MGSKPVKPINYDELHLHEENYSHLSNDVINLYNKVIYDTEIHPEHLKFFLSAISGKRDVMIFFYTTKSDIIAFRFNSLSYLERRNIQINANEDGEYSINVNYSSTDKTLQVIYIQQFGKLTNTSNRWFSVSGNFRLQSSIIHNSVTVGNILTIEKFRDSDFSIIRVYNLHKQLYLQNNERNCIINNINNGIISRIVVATT
ncbi:hypothetical protein QTN25_009487 [Entamoeba marina]